MPHESFEWIKFNYKCVKIDDGWLEFAKFFDQAK